MRLSKLVFSFAFLLAGAGLSVFAAILAVNLIEETTETDVRRALSAAGYHWADVETAGLQVFVIGYAPSEAMRFKAKSAAGTVVDATRVIDQMNVIDSVEITPPDFKLEILRTNNAVSVMGMLPARYGVDSLIASITESVGPDAKISQLLQTADFPVAENWATAVRASIDLLSLADSAKLTVSAGEIQGNLVAQDYAEGQAFERQIGILSSGDVTTDIIITAPRRVIAPFVFSVSKTEASKEISMGCRVIATSSSDAKLERLGALGAEHLINYKTHANWGEQAFELTGGAGIDLVVEVGGPGNLPQSISALAVDGCISLIGVLTGWSGEVPTAALMTKNGRLSGITVGSQLDQANMTAAVEAHDMQPVIDKTFPLAELADAFRYQESQQHFGKICVSL